MISIFQSKIITKGAANAITKKVYYDNYSASLMPKKFILHSILSLHGTGTYVADIENFCAPIVHLVAGEIIYNYEH